MTINDAFPFIALPPTDPIFGSFWLEEGKE